jgi:aminotransferase
MKEIRIYEPDIGYKEILNVAKTMFNGWIEYGESVSNFKEKICEKLKLDKNKAIITGNATNALFILFKTLKLNGEVIVPSISYAGIANSITESSCKVVLCDVEEDLNPSIYNIKKVYTKKTKALVINNYGGVQSEQLYKIKNFCKEKNIILIEDRACNLLGGNNNHLADFVIYSFNNAKILTTIEGGMIYINNNKYIKHFDELQIYTFLGRKKNLETNIFDYFPNENIIVPGNKSIMSSVGAEIGLAQIEKLDSFIEKRLENEYIYQKKLMNDFYVPKNSKYPKNWYWIRTNKEKKIKLIKKLIENKINVNFKYYPLHMTNLYKEDNNNLIKSTELYEQIICLPVHTKLKNEDIKKICDILLNNDRKNITI